MTNLLVHLLDCAVVSCVLPQCPNSVFPPGRCCPVCPSPPLPPGRNLVYNFIHVNNELYMLCHASVFSVPIVL